jgi:mono/diheme cytochrome c family protein
MKSLIKLITVVMIFVSVVACNSKSSRNYQYMPNMYESVGYEAYQEADVFDNNMEAQEPAEGTIPRGGHLPLGIAGDNDGYLEAKANLKNPLDPKELEEPEGGQLYDIYCGICHGKNGNGKGILVEREKILGVPSYDDVGRAITEGSVYHVIYYGKNAMGSYKNQIDEKERWLVTDYVMQLKAELEGSSKDTKEDSAVNAVTEKATDPLAK